jgi:hypothetical protein
VSGEKREEEVYRKLNMQDIYKETKAKCRFTGNE